MKEIKQEIRFCASRDGTRIAYARSGQGRPVVRVPGWMSHLEHEAASPLCRHWIAGLSASYTLWRYDQRGCGLSDHSPAEISFARWVDDLEAVIDASGAEQVALLGTLSGAAVAMAYAARHPARVRRLVLLGAFLRGRLRRDADERDREEARILLELAGLGWDRRDSSLRQCFTAQFVPSGDLAHWRCFDQLLRTSTSGGNAVRIMRELYAIDVSALACAVRCPTLVFHARGDLRVPFEQGRLLAAAIPGARLEPLDSGNHMLLEDEPAWQTFVRETGAFLAEPGDLAAAGSGGTKLEELTPRERQVLERVAAGLANPQIAAQLGLCEKTVRNHLTSIFAKMQVNTRAQAIVRAREAGVGIALPANAASAHFLPDQSVIPGSFHGPLR